MVKLFSSNFFCLARGNACSPEGVAPSEPTVAPTLSLHVEVGTESIAMLDWTASNNPGGATGFGYRIWRGEPAAPDVNDPPFATVGNVLVYDDDNTGSPGDYHYIVRAFNDEGEGPSSNTANIVLPGEPDGPTLLGPNSTSNSQYVYDDFTLTWSAVPGATLYDVYGSAVDSGYTLWDGDVAATSLSIDFATAFGTNWWYVVAHDGGGNFSAQSNHLECTPIMETPTYTYRRPGGVDTYRRPGGTDTYLRP